MDALLKGCHNLKRLKQCMLLHNTDQMKSQLPISCDKFGCFYEQAKNNRLTEEFIRTVSATFSYQTASSRVLGLEPFILI